MNKFDITRWRQLSESLDKNKRMTEEEKKQTLDAVSRFNELGRSIYKTEEISELIETIKTMAENASRMAIEETADWFDAVSVKRDTKSIGESIKVFEGTFKEISTLQQRLESVFEDMGAKLGKYYEIKELNETEAQDKYQAKFKDALDDEGVDSPADLDDEEKKDFFNKIDKMHKSKNESTIRLENILRKLGNLENKAIKEADVTELNEAKKFYLIGNKEVSRDKVLSYMYSNPEKPVADRGWPKWLYTNNGPNGKTLEWSSIKKDMKDLEKKYGKGNVVVGGSTNAGGPYIEIYSKSQNESVVTEQGTGFSTWTVEFDPQEISGVKLGSKSYSVTARTTVEAIKKAAASAGLKGNDWMAATVSKLVKTK